MCYTFCSRKELLGLKLSPALEYKSQKQRAISALDKVQYRQNSKIVPYADSCNEISHHMIKNIIAYLFSIHVAIYSTSNLFRYIMNSVSAQDVNISNF